MKTEKETVSDIIAWLRAVGNISENLHDMYHCIADRLEAAIKEEVEK